MKISYLTSRILDVYPYFEIYELERQLAYGSFASVKDRFFYLEVPKAACTTLKNVLREVHGNPPLKLFGRRTRETRRSMFIHTRENIPFPSLNAIDDSEQRDLLEAPDVLRFTVVRNPYTRLVSAWRDKIVLCEPGVEQVHAAVRGSAPAMGRKTPVEFAEFVEYIERSDGRLWDRHWRRQVDLVFPKAISYTHIGKTEDLHSTVAILERQLGRQTVESYRNSNEGAIKPPARYSKELAERVRVLYHADFLTFGYDPDAWPKESEARPRTVSEEQFVDEVVERNVVIGHLYDERERLINKYEGAYRYSLVRIADKLRGLLGTLKRKVSSCF